MSAHDKKLLFEDFISAVEKHKAQGKTVVQSHGVFDLIHPGTIKHLNEAKEQGDILVVTVIKDSDVRRGPGRPVFAEDHRAETVANLSCVDYVSIVEDTFPFECVKRVQPHIFARGQDHRERNPSIERKIFEEEKEMRLGSCKIYKTSGLTASSSQIINQVLEMYPPETRDFLRAFSERFSMDSILERLDTLQDKKIFLIGDGIIDEYWFCETMGKSSKSHLVVNKYLSHEVYCGGVLAVANHLAGLCNEVHLVTLLGKEDTREAYIRENMKENVKLHFFYRDDGPTIVKRRYINRSNNQKMFEIIHINDEYISGSLNDTIISYIESEAGEFDLCMVSDFGHGFINKSIIETLKKHAPKLAVNAQTNGANTGYNYITRYSDFSFACLDAPEARLATQEKNAEIELVAKDLKHLLQTENISVTLGREGSIAIDKEGTVHRTPAFAAKVVDTIGAGDAYFAYSAPCVAADFPAELSSFIGNAVGALAVQVLCNKKPIEKYDVLAFIKTLLKQGSISYENI